MDFGGRVVVVTGAARGLGQEYARQFATRGARVAVSDLRDCGETLQIVEAQGAQGIATATDVRSAASCADMAAEVLDNFGRIDVLINNAAGFNRAPFLDVDLASFVMSLPFRLKMNGDSDKLILRQTFQSFWPVKIQNRKKNKTEMVQSQVCEFQMTGRS